MRKKIFRCFVLFVFLICGILCNLDVCLADVTAFPGIINVASDWNGSSIDLHIDITNNENADYNYNVSSVIPDYLLKGYFPGDVDWISLSKDSVFVMSSSSIVFPFHLEVPSDLDSGDYELWIKFSGDNEYVCGILVNVAKKPESNSSNLTIPLIIILSVLVIVVGGYVYMKLRGAR